MLNDDLISFKSYFLLLKNHSDQFIAMVMKGTTFFSRVLVIFSKVFKLIVPRFFVPGLGSSLTTFANFVCCAHRLR